MSQQLSQTASDRAREFLKTRARPLDRALFEYHFEDAPAENVLAELARFQNSDGGFGHALEPDMRTPTSSALATAIGLQTLKELGCRADHPLVRPAVEFLLATFDAATRVWRIIPTDANDYPHAPWWHDEGGSLARTFDDFAINPRAEVVGLLHHYAALVPAAWLDEVTQDTVACIESFEKLGAGGGDDLTCILGLAETAVLPEQVRSRLATRLRAVVPGAITRAPEKWNTYCIPPLKLAPSPRSLVADLVADALQVNLDYVIEHQTAEGTWEPTWSWGPLYPKVGEQAKLEWRGKLTLDTLIMLRAFGRFDSEMVHGGARPRGESVA
jgi:hypothetical protein